MSREKAKPMTKKDMMKARKKKAKVMKGLMAERVSEAEAREGGLVLLRKFEAASNEPEILTIGSDPDEMPDGFVSVSDLPADWKNSRDPGSDGLPAKKMTRHFEEIYEAASMLARNGLAGVLSDEDSKELAALAVEALEMLEERHGIR